MQLCRTHKETESDKYFFLKTNPQALFLITPRNPLPIKQKSAPINDTYPGRILHVNESYSLASGSYHDELSVAHGIVGWETGLNELL